MRNWNSGSIRANLLDVASVFSLPMRNWNRILTGSRSPNAGIVFSLPMRNWNHERVRHGRRNNLRFQPTYEELKHNSCQKAKSSGSVFSLPMRNWNPHSQGSLRAGKSLFSAYLWGIETGHEDLESLFADQFSAYLWGIETPEKLS